MVANSLLTSAPLAGPAGEPPPLGQLPGGRKRGRKRKDPVRIERPSMLPQAKRPRGRPKGSGGMKRDAPTDQSVLKKRRGRRSLMSSVSQKDVSSSHSNTTVGISESHDVPSVIVPAGLSDGSVGDTTVGHHLIHTNPKRLQEEKRRQLLLKARADRARKRSDGMRRSTILNQRRIAQRQRRERERLLMKEARERQDKITKQREAEDREVRRQQMAQQREVDNQRKARERTLRLLAHLKQQEVNRDRRVYQIQLEKEKAEQLKRPTEDLLVRESAGLPLLRQIQWVRLPARAFADLLMTVEFTKSFNEFLELEPAPTVPALFGGLYNLSDGKADLMGLFVQLLKAVIYDPGCGAMTMAGWAVKSVEVRNDTMSELLRLYLYDRLEEVEKEADTLNKVCVALETCPLESLRPSDKMAVLSFLVEELLSSDALCREVDTRMEQIASLRREKWKISLKLKRFRSRLETVYGIGQQKKPVVYSGRGRPPKRALLVVAMENSSQPAADGGTTVAESSDEEEDPDNPEVNSIEYEYSEEETDEEAPEGKEDLQRKIRSLKKKFQYVRSRIHLTSRRMRKFPLGQDRFARQYWLLPELGGVVVEGIETSLHGNLHLIGQGPQGGGAVVNKWKAEGEEEEEEMKVDGSPSSLVIDEAPDRPILEQDDSAAASLSGATSPDMLTGENTPNESPQPQPMADTAHYEPTSLSPLPHPPPLSPSPQPPAQLPPSEISPSPPAPANQATQYAHPLTQTHSCSPATSQRHADGSTAAAPPPSSSSGQAVGVGGAKNHLQQLAPPSLPQAREQEDEEKEEEEEEEREASMETKEVEQKCEQQEQDSERTLENGHEWATSEHEASPGQPASSLSQPLERWFSLHPRVACEQAQSVAVAVASADPSGSVAQLQVQVSPEGQVVAGQQYIMATAPVAPSYAYITPQGAIVGQPMVQQVGASYIIGNTVVPQATVSAQYLGVNPATQSAQPVQYVVQNQQGVQYVVASGAQQSPGVQYVSLGGNQIAVVQSGAEGQLAMVQQQPAGVGGQVAIVSQGDGNAQVAIIQPGVDAQLAVGKTSQSAGVHQSLDGARVALVQGDGTGQQVMVAQQQLAGAAVVVGGGGEGVKLENAASDEGVKVAVAVADNNKEQVLVTIKKEEDGDTSSSTSQRPSWSAQKTSSLQQIPKEEETPHVPPPPLSPPSHVTQGKESLSEAIETVANPSAQQQQPVVMVQQSQTQDQQQFITAMLPAGPSGQPQYISLPADPRVISGQCSYAMLQQPDGNSQIVLVENSAVGGAVGEDSSGTSQATTVLTFECPQAVMLGGEVECETWQVEITLMYAENLPFLPGQPQPSQEKEEVKEKSLRELLDEQKKGLTHGWWCVTNLYDIEKILRTLCIRGYREKGLYKALQKNKEMVGKLLDPATLSKCDLRFGSLEQQLQEEEREEEERRRRKREMEAKEKEREEEEEEEESESEESESESDKDSDSSESMETEPSSSPTNETAASGHMTNPGEPTNEIAASTNGIAPPGHMTNPTNETTISSNATESTDETAASGHTTPPTNEITQSNPVAILEGEFDPEFPGCVYQAALELAEYLDGMSGRLDSAQLYTDFPPEDSLATRLGSKVVDYPLKAIADTLLELERVVDRRYLKPPLRDRALATEEQNRPSKSQRGRGSSLPSKRSSAEPPTSELLEWRAAVERAQSASQLAICTNQLERSIAWEKSNIKVFCQVCHGGEKESLLLLCDSCDRGTHTFCCQPPLEEIPDGNWYCRECIINKRKLGTCAVCGSPRGALIICSGCPKVFHKRCLNPPLNRMPPKGWKCQSCRKRSPNKGRGKGGGAGRRGRQNDMSICRKLLKSLDAHSDAWPFRTAVHRKKFPEYFKVIKQPMDFHTMAIKLREGKYANREAFATDARLVFSNCEIYNEDDSEIGMAGHSMKAFFERRWKELTQ